VYSPHAKVMRDRKTRLLVVIAHLSQGGSERFAYELCNAIDRSRFDVEVLTKRRPRPGDYYDEKIRELGIPIHRKLPIFLHYIRRYARPLYRFTPVRLLVETLHRLAARLFMPGLLDQFDVIEAVQLENYYLLQPLLPDNEKVIIHLMSMAFQYDENPYLDCSPGRKYRFVVFDPAMKDDFRESNCSNAEVFSFPLAMDFGDPPDLSASARIEPPYKVGVFIRRHRERPVSGILRAFARLSDSVDAQLVMYGRGRGVHLRAELSDLGIADRVIFEPHADIERVLRDDGLSFVWMTCNGPLLGYASIEVASRAFPMLFWNQSETPAAEALAVTGGAVHAHHDPDDLAAETLDLLRDPEELREIGRKLRRHTLETYDMHRHIRRLEVKLDEIASTARTPNVSMDMGKF
jgi:glycosyltransferase involved in cell wall biosynthesis